MSETPKYKIFEGYKSDVEELINEAIHDGYKLHTFTAMLVHSEHIMVPNYIAVMSLSSSTKYDDIERLVDVAPHEVNGWLDKGYIVADSWAKNIRMVKKK